jgi:hypothetical protein
MLFSMNILGMFSMFKWDCRLFDLTFRHACFSLISHGLRVLELPDPDTGDKAWIYRENVCCLRRPKYCKHFIKIETKKNDRKAINIKKE